jgi:uncharacterized protein
VKSRLAARLASILRPNWCFRIGEKVCASGATPQGVIFLGSAARRGHAGAQLRIGRLYLSGEGLPPSRAEAARWLRRAAESGLLTAQHAYATLLWSEPRYAEGHDLLALSRPSAPAALGLRDVAEAMLWAGRAAEAGLAEAQALLGQILCFGPDRVRDAARGEALFAQAAAAGQPEGYLGLAVLLYRRAAGDPARIAQARQLFTQAADGGSPYALFALGIMAESAARDDRGWREAAGFYARAAKHGHRAAQARFGVLLVEGIGAARNPVEGESWVRKAALAGEKDAAAWLGDHYAHPQGALPPHLPEAAAWYRRAADLGHGQAARRLGVLYRDGMIGEDVQEATALFQLAARLGETSALAELQTLIQAGALPRSAMTTTIEHLPAGQYWYGRTLLDQTKTQPDQAEARHWIARAAESGLPAAQAVLAEMMLHGRGGPRDIAGAVQSFEAAAAGGHLGAIFALGVLYAGVAGVPRDLPQSEARLQEAAARGHAPAQAELKKFRAAGLYT